MSRSRHPNRTRIPSPRLRTTAAAAGAAGSDVDAGRLSAAELADLLREAERAHAAYEKQLGQRDEDWPAWYATWIVEQLRQREAGPGP